jgi:hypothetical protein
LLVVLLVLCRWHVGGRRWLVQAAVFVAVVVAGVFDYVTKKLLIVT